MWSSNNQFKLVGCHVSSHQCQPDWVSDEWVAPCLPPSCGRASVCITACIVTLGSHSLGLTGRLQRLLLWLSGMPQRSQPRKRVPPNTAPVTPGPGKFNQSYIRQWWRKKAENGNENKTLEEVSKRETELTLPSGIVNHVLYNSRKWWWTENTNTQTFVSLFFCSISFFFQTCSISFERGSRCDTN